MSDAMKFYYTNYKPKECNFIFELKATGMNWTDIADLYHHAEWLKVVGFQANEKNVSYVRHFKNAHLRESL